MPGSSSWMPCAPQGVKGFDDDDDDDDDNAQCCYNTPPPHTHTHTHQPGNSASVVHSRST